MKKRLRNLLGYLVANTFIMTGMVRYATKRALNTKCILALYFHKPGKTEFEFCIKWLQKKGFRFLSPHDLEMIINEALPFPKGAVLLTVDDGWQSNITNVVEVANRYKVPVTIFVATTPTEEGPYWWSYIEQAKQRGITSPSKKAMKKMPEEKRLNILQDIKKKIYPARDAMTVDQLKSIAASPYVTIGAHTQTHPILINCQEKQVYEELSISRQKLEAWTGKEVVYFAYPNGDYGHREIKMLETLQYRLAFSSSPDYLTPKLLKDHFTLPRFGFLEGASFAENICRITGVWQPIMLKLPYHNATGSKAKKSSWLKNILYDAVHLHDIDNSTHTL
jgi:poly-beta-1,6-N-acetyl-D-glucosamine N-deacetylase